MPLKRLIQVGRERWWSLRKYIMTSIWHCRASWLRTTRSKTSTKCTSILTRVGKSSKNNPKLWFLKISQPMARTSTAQWKNKRGPSQTTAAWSIFRRKTWPPQPCCSSTTPTPVKKPFSSIIILWQKWKTWLKSNPVKLRVPKSKCGQSQAPLLIQTAR